MNRELTPTECQHLHFKHPFSALVAGPSGSGKTEFVKTLVQKYIIDPPPERIVWVYREWQPAYASLQPKVKFVYDYPDDDEVLVSNPHKRHVLVFDDLMGSKKASDHIVEWFTRKGHHRNTSVIYITQNLFDKNNKNQRTISLNAHYMVLFKNPRDKSQIEVLARQLKLPSLPFAYTDATKRPHGYLVLDMTPTTPDEFRCRTDVMEGTPTLYAPLDYKIV